MQKTRQLPLPQELKSRIQEYASDRMEAHPTAHLIRTLSFFANNDNLKVVLTDFNSHDYFIVLREGAGTMYDHIVLLILRNDKSPPTTLTRP